jgi:hypothetical protein
MEELKNQIVAKLGLDPSQAQSTIEMVLNFVKDKLPENLRGMVDSALSGNSEGGSDVVDQAKNMLGGFFK